MKKPTDTLLVPGDERFEAWRTNGSSGPTMERVDGPSRKAPGWIGLPVRSLVSVPMRLEGVQGEHRESAALLELEAAGLADEELGVNAFEIRSCSVGDGEGRVDVVIQHGLLDEEMLGSAIDSHFVPSFAFKRFYPGEARIWREQGVLVLALPDAGGNVVHCQALSCRSLDNDTAAEIRCVMAGLELSGVAPKILSLVIDSDSAAEDVIPVSFESGLELPVAIRPAEPPQVPEGLSRLIPESVLQARRERKQRNMIILGAVALVTLTVAMLGAFAGRLAWREQELLAEERRLDALEPELASIREAQLGWDQLAGVMTPEEYPVELLHQLITLLPPEGIRLTRFELRPEGLVLDGEASSIGHGIQFRESLVSSPVFSSWGFERGFPQPTNLPDGRATFRAEGRGRVLDDESPTS